MILRRQRGFEEITSSILIFQSFYPLSLISTVYSRHWQSACPADTVSLSLIEGSVAILQKMLPENFCCCGFDIANVNIFKF